MPSGVFSAVLFFCLLSLLSLYRMGSFSSPFFSIFAVIQDGFLFFSLLSLPLYRMGFFSFLFYLCCIQDGQESSEEWLLGNQSMRSMFVICTLIGIITTQDGQGSSQKWLLGSQSWHGDLTCAYLCLCCVSRLIYDM